eukprot:Pgem_evm1s16598
MCTYKKFKKVQAENSNARTALSRQLLDSSFNFMFDYVDWVMCEFDAKHPLTK